MLLHCLNYLLRLYFLLACANVLAQWPTTSDCLKIDSLATATLKATNTSGAYLSILHKGQSSYQQAFGYANVAQQLPFNDSMQFPISSNTKAFTGMLIAQQVSVNKISLDTPIQHYLPQLNLGDPYITKEVTLLDLLTHRYGMPRYDYAYYSLFDHDLPQANAAVVKRMKHFEPISGFRTKFIYGNNQYILAAHTLETVLQRSWKQLLQEQLLDPLQMGATHTSLATYKAANNRSIGYQKGKEVSIDWVAPLYQVDGMGNLFSTIKDLNKWCQFLLGNHQSSLAKGAVEVGLKGYFSIGFEEPYTGFSPIQYGLGWYVFDYFGQPVVLHHGDNIGHQTLVVILPDADLAWVMVSNEGFANESFAFNMTFALLELYLNKPLSNWNELRANETERYWVYPDQLKDSTKPPSLALAGYAGTYESAAWGSFELLLKDGQLWFEKNSLKFPVEHLAGELFRIDAAIFGEDYKLEFSFHDDGSGLTGAFTDMVEPMQAPVFFEKHH